MRKFSRLFAIAVLALGIGQSIAAIDKAEAAGPSVVLALPPTLCGSPVTGAQGATYTPNAACQITVSNWIDADSFEADGAIVVPAGAWPVQLKLTDAKQVTGVPLVASGCGLSCNTPVVTLGTSVDLSGPGSLSNTQQGSAVFELILPPYYVAGQNVTCTANANYTGSGTADTVVKTIIVNAYLAANAGTLGSNLTTTAAQTMTGTAADYAFTITGSGLTPGSRLMLEVHTQLKETAGTVIYPNLNSLRCG